MPIVSDYFKTKNYANLLTQVQNLLAEDLANQGIDPTPQRLKTYWRIGHKMLLAQDENSSLQFSPKSEALVRVAQDLETSGSNLYKMICFKRCWPKDAPVLKNGQCLSWAHHCELFSLKDNPERRFYHDEALRHTWSRNTLRQAIKMNLYQQIQSSGKHGQIPPMKSSFYTYKAFVARALDGDTLLVKVDLGFGILNEAMLRLRGINTPELGQDPTGRAEQAKARLEAILKPLPFVVIKTYKTDVYGRFLTDVYYHPILEDKEELLKKGVFLNQQMLDEGLADWLVM